MGPRLVSRGDPARGKKKSRTSGSFNGAAACEPRRQESRPNTELMWESFNGAAACEPRRLHPSPFPLPSEKASMGPRLVSRGDELTMEWGKGYSGASMGPRLVSRGDERMIAGYDTETVLQWGRGL